MDKTRCVRDLIRRGTETLAATSGTPKLDAEVLLRHVLGWTRTELLIYENEVVSPVAIQSYLALLARRSLHEPIAYLTGSKEFYGRDFLVSPAVLCPRPETELLIEAALAAISDCGSVSFLDLGTGSGCIAITLAAECSGQGLNCKGLAIDASEPALEVARQNAATLVSQMDLRFQYSNWFSTITPGSKFDLIVSNPPYVEDDAGESPELAFEPASALYAGPAGLNAYRSIFSGISDFVTAESIALFEIGSTQGTAVSELAREMLGPACQLSVKQDLAGLDRLLEIRF